MSDYYYDYEAEDYVASFSGVFVVALGIIVIVVIICYKKYQKRRITTVQPAPTNMTSVPHSTGNGH